MRARLPRILATALITAGLVVMADVGVTLAWGEPISALRALLAQSQAAEELDRLKADFAEAGAGSRLERSRLPALARRLARSTGAGDAIARIRIPAIDAGYVVVEGTDTASLHKGPGHYPQTVLPGQRGTVAVAGHRTTYLAPFRNIDDIASGDEITVEMPYARFSYRFEGARIVDPSRVGVVRRVDHNRLVLTACHPLYSASQRYVVFARLVDVGPPS